MALSTSDLVSGPWGNSEAWEPQTLADLPVRGFKTSTVGQTATFTKWVMGTRNPHSVPFLKSLRDFPFGMHVLLPRRRGCHIWPAAKLCGQRWGADGAAKGSREPSTTRAPRAEEGCVGAVGMLPSLTPVSR